MTYLIAYLALSPVFTLLACAFFKGAAEGESQ